MVSALSGTRPKLKRLLADPDVLVIVAEHRDGLARVGVGYIEAGLSVRGRIVRAVDGGDVEDDLVREVRDVLTSLGARRYGRRAPGDRAEQALATAREDTV